ncbi:hypothetical protein GF412_00960 [Candidatus Micrarchaeota archaeon]|nr:hypothetical protein [Candidatus Micrarchaeota archaeon]MBD3417542.1 hypothetical protein [Candidatus Micrarchaeota archaeon]
MATQLANGNYDAAAQLFWERFIDLVMAPASEPDMLWFAIPLIIATVLMALYFGRYRWEELGWNSSFANTMVFLFVSIDLVRRMYESKIPFSWMNIYENPLYLTITIALALFSITSMLVVYYHLLPKRLAFTIFSNLPVNLAVYTVMTIVYVGVPADWTTVGAGILLFLVVWLLLKLLQFLQRLSAKRHEEEEKGDWDSEGNGEYELDEKDLEKGPQGSMKVKEGKRSGKEKKANAAKKRKKK